MTPNFIPVSSPIRLYFESNMRPEFVELRGSI